jgi:nucleoid-associated protein YgaU
MALSTSSRYTASVDAAGTPIAVRKRTLPVSYNTYVTKSGDTFALIATRVYGTPEDFWRIADINPQVVFPDEIPVGTNIRIPT